VKNDKTAGIFLFDIIYLFYLFMYANAFISPFFTLLPLSLWKLITVFAVGLLFACICLSFKSIKIPLLQSKAALVVFFLVIIFSSATSVYYHSYLPIYLNFSFLLISLLLIFFTSKHGKIFVGISTVFVCLLILGAYIGVLYAYLGGEPVFVFPNGDGRLNSIYLTTGTNFHIGRFIRPSGIYDEPGALSFFICSVCLLRVFFNKNDTITLFIMIFGMITSSLTHLLILICFVSYYLFRYKNKSSTYAYFLSFFVIGMIILAVFYNLFDTLLFSRLRYNPSTGAISGDTRSHLFLNALGMIDIKSFFWGLDRTVYTNENLFRSAFPFIGDNPLTPLVKYGFFSQWYYYFMLFIIFLAGLFQRKYFFICVAVCLLFFQRPNPHVISYNFYFVLFYLISVKIIGANKNMLRCFLINKNAVNGGL
jgi:hypothetical protein